MVRLATRPLAVWPGLALLLAAVLDPSAVALAQDPSAGDRFFTEQIEPLLRSKCFSCHSHQAGETAGSLTLDSQSGWSVGGERGPAIVVHKPEESLLIEAVRYTHDDLQMPPEEKLSEQEIKLLVRWVTEGAPDPRPAVQPEPRGDPIDWWSLQPLQRPEVPGIQSASGETLSPIDAFIEQKLGEAGLSPVPRADRRKLIRRLFFDLHGLPPTPDEVAAFVNDPDPAADANLVDRLLQSPRYGERWARHWLDTVHFADSHGCEHDVLRPNAWRYRDYVIDSFNRDTPWPRFIREQLAADHFYPEETQLIAALGFIAAGPLELSRAGTAPVTFDYLDRDDMVTQTMAAFASTTANCARCHDHKFDPITQQDYYSLQAVFAGIGKGDVDFDADPMVARQRQRWSDLLASASRNDSAVLLAPEHAAMVQAWESKQGSQSAIWQTLVPSTFLSTNHSTLTRLDDHSILASGTRPDQDTYTFTAAVDLAKLSALRLDVLSDERLPMQGPGRQDNGNLHLTEFEALVFDPQADEPTPVKFRQAVADWDQEGWTISHALDGDVKTAWGIHPKVGQSHHAVFELEHPLELKASSRIVVVLKQLHGGGHLIGRFKLYATDGDHATATVVPESVAAALKLPQDQRSPEQRTAIAAHAVAMHAQQQLDALPMPATVYAASDRYSHANKLDQPQTPKVVHVLKRGNIDRPGEVALPGAMSVIPTIPGRFELQDVNDESERRAALADWLASRDNPLSWRSVVNRVWAYHFGRGLCETPNDLGRMGGEVSHPELLDHLAVWFRDDAKGSIKQLHRAILLSQAYQRDSSSLPHDQFTEHRSRDPQNRLLWRANRRPLDAESYRDTVLQLSGRIDWTMGGPGIQQFTLTKGPQATPELDYDAFDWDAPQAARRSIYRVVWRGIADPFMESLDFPDLGLLAPKRNMSISALQALAMFNNDFVLHHSQVLAERLQSEQESLDQQVAAACKLIYQREPEADELAMLQQYATKHGLAATCRILFNSNEFVFID